MFKSAVQLRGAADLALQELAERDAMFASYRDDRFRVANAYLGQTSSLITLVSLDPHHPISTITVLFSGRRDTPEVSASWR